MYSTPAATSLNEYNVFANAPGFIEADRQLTKVAATEQIEASGFSGLAATSVGNHILISSNNTNLNVYDNSLTKLQSVYLSANCASGGAATTLNGYAMFGGGRNFNASSTFLDEVIVFDSSLTRTTPVKLSVGRSGLPATTIGEYALFGAGNGKYSSTIDIPAEATMDAFKLNT